MLKRFIPTAAVIAVLLTFTTATVQAAGAEAGAHRGQRIKQALGQLNLSSSQRGRIKQILADARKHRESQDGADGRSANPHAGKAVLKKILNVLTPEQLTRFEQILQSEKSPRVAIKRLSCASGVG